MVLHLVPWSGKRSSTLLGNDNYSCPEQHSIKKHSMDRETGWSVTGPRKNLDVTSYNSDIHSFAHLPSAYFGGQINDEFIGISLGWEGRDIQKH